jgi:hypothetical protein
MEDVKALKKVPDSTGRFKSLLNAPAIFYSLQYPPKPVDISLLLIGIATALRRVTRNALLSAQYCYHVWLMAWHRHPTHRSNALPAGEPSIT